MRRWLALLAVVALTAWLVSLAARSTRHAATVDAATAVPETGGEITLDPARVAPRPGATTARLEGWVGDTTKHGLPGATVCATASDADLVDEDTVPYCVTAGEDGRYAFAALPIGAYDVAASAPHHRPASTTDLVTLVAGAPHDFVDLVLEPGGVAVQGKVEDPLGRPVPGARVTATSLAESDEDFASVPAFTDGEGHYTVWTPPGAAYVEVAAKDHVRVGRTVTSPSAQEDFSLVFGASLVGLALDESGAPVPAARIEVAVGHEHFTARTGADGGYRIDGMPAGDATLEARAVGLLSTGLGGVPLLAGDLATAPPLTLHPVGRVVVTVRTPGARCQGSVSLSGDDWTESASANVDAHGVATLDVVHEGKHSVVVHCTGWVQTRASLIVAPTGTTTLTVDVARGATVEGTVVDTTGRPLAKGSVWIDRPKSGEHGFADVKAGAFSFAGLAAGAYDLHVSAPGHVDHVAKLNVSGMELAKVHVTLIAAATIRGKVVDVHGVPIVGAQVRFVGPDGDVGDYARTDAKGAYVLGGVPTTTGHLQVSKGTELALAMTAAPDDQGLPFTAKAGQSLTQDLVVESCAHTIRGTVQDAAGKPVAGATVAVRRHVEGSSGWSHGEVVTDAAGAFTVTGLPAGDYVLHATAANGAATAKATVDGAVTLALVPFGKVSGVVTGAKRRLRVSISSNDLDVYRTEEFFATSGAFVVSGLPAGTYELEVRVDGGAAKESVTVVAGAEQTVLLHATKE